uniref:MIP03860p n=1 Tax=Drosophila melanogaster TaxID=7227 RepID=Q2PDS5_DROME
MTTPATTDKNNDNNTSSNTNNNSSNKKSNESRQQQRDMARTTTMAAGKASGKMREENIWHTLRRAKSLTDFLPISPARFPPFSAFPPHPPLGAPHWSDTVCALA